MPARTHATVRRQLAIFYAVSAVTFLAVSFGAFIACKSIARNQAFQDAERMSSRMAQFVVSPLLSGALTPGSDEARELNRAISDRISDGYLVEAFVWDSTGRVVWASDPLDIGRSAAVPSQVTAAIEHRTVSSGFEDQPEIAPRGPPRNDQGFVEVYVPFPPGEHPTLAFEAYYDYVRVNQTASALVKQTLPLVLVLLVLLQLIQVPIAGSLARRVRRHEVERTLLLERTLTVSEKERARLAADLHDGPIQDLAGIGYALGAIAPATPSRHAKLMGTVQETVHRTTESLRRMMVDLYPPDLVASQLPEVIGALAVPLIEHGITVNLDLGPVPDLSNEIVTTVYRVAREALANVLEHSQATQVDIVLAVETSSDGHGHVVQLDVVDNGVGLDLDKLEGRAAQGHLGLRLLQGRVSDVGGTLTVTPGKPGTVVRAVIPIRLDTAGLGHDRTVLTARPPVDLPSS